MLRLDRQCITVINDTVREGETVTEQISVLQNVLGKDHGAKTTIKHRLSVSGAMERLEVYRYYWKTSSGLLVNLSELHFQKKT